MLNIGVCAFGLFLTYSTARVACTSIKARPICLRDGSAVLKGLRRGSGQQFKHIATLTTQLADIYTDATHKCKRRKLEPSLCYVTYTLLSVVRKQGIGFDDRQHLCSFSEPSTYVRQVLLWSLKPAPTLFFSGGDLARTCKAISICK